MTRSYLKLIVLVLAVIELANANENITYEDYRSVKIFFENEDQLTVLDQYRTNLQFIVINEVKQPKIIVDVLISPLLIDNVIENLNSNGINFTITSTNIQKEIDTQAEESQAQAKSGEIVGTYARYEQIMDYIDEIVRDNDDIASSFVIGNTYEGRLLKTLVLKTSTSQKAVWLDSGIHAREWVTVSSTIWFIDRLITDYRNGDEKAVDLLSYYEFHILPIVNPDGYEYTHTKDRMWRKNRRPNEDSECIGVDLNRNFDFHWMFSGASNDSCDITYAGPYPNSESEVSAITETIQSGIADFEIFFSLHAYSNFWFIPYAFTDSPSPDRELLLKYAQLGADELEKLNGTKYLVETPAIILYAAAGGSYDWAYGVANITYSFTLELSPSSDDRTIPNGFILPVDRVPSIGEETYVGLTAAIKAIKDRVYE